MVCWTPSQPLYTTAQYLATHAREQPRARAITDGTTDCSYRDLAINVVRIMDALTGIGIRPGQVVGVEMNDRFLHLVLLLACETLGATTISLLPFELGPDMDMGSVCDCILVTEPCGGANADKTFELTQEWLLQALLVPVGEHRLADLGRAPDPDSLVRLIKSSGTTGKPKVMGMTYRVQQRTLRNNLLYAADHIEPHPNYFCLYHFTIRGCHSRALLTLQLGGTIHFATFETAWNVLGARTVNFALFVTGDLERLVRNPPRNAVPFEIHVDVIGAALSPRLRRDTMQTLTTRILVTYGTNEVHHIAAVDADNVGTLFPGVEVTIVDDHGNKVPIGQTGLIRIRSDTMADGYVDAPALTKAAFIDGWYHTGDQGFQPSPGTLVVLGRTDDMLNVGGMKIPAGPVVAQIKAVDGIDDAMVARAVDGAGREVLLVAVEVGSNGGPPDLEGLISPIIQRYSSTYELLPLPAFPRTETGKIQRQAVQQAYRRTAGPNDG
jgi:acyl-coenzyme A synthetase/AMP-(fatty) acid ligase